MSQELDERNKKLLKIEKELKESKSILKDKEVTSKIKLLKAIQKKYKEEKDLGNLLKKN